MQTDMVRVKGFLYILSIDQTWGAGDRSLPEARSAYFVACFSLQATQLFSLLLAITTSRGLRAAGRLCPLSATPWPYTHIPNTSFRFLRML